MTKTVLFLQVDLKLIPWVPDSGVVEVDINLGRELPVSGLTKRKIQAGNFIYRVFCNITLSISSDVVTIFAGHQ